MNDVLISVIVPVYRENNLYLKKCLDSLCSQSFQNMEIILSDDGMTEENRELAETYMHQYPMISRIGGTNEGVSAARNRGIEKAQGEWLAFVDSDDWIDPQYLEKLYAAAVRESADIVLCGYKRVYETNEEVIVKDSSFPMNSEEYLHHVLNVQNGFGFVHMKLYRKSLLAGGVRFHTELSLAEDALFNIEICGSAQKIYYIAEPLYCYRFNSNSAVRRFRPDYARNFQKSMELTDAVLQKSAVPYQRTDFENYAAYHVLLILVNYCCHPENEKKGIRSIKEVLAVPVFAEAVRNSSFENLSMTRKITLAMLKCRAYGIANLIGVIRQTQFKRSRS